MATDIELLRAIERSPMRTARYADLRGLGTNVWRTLDGLVEQGAVARLAHGVYTVPPDDADGRTWKPTLEAAGLAVATARFGNRNAVLMGIGAARYWAAIPRAIGATMVAVPKAGQAPVELEHGGILHFVPRELHKLHAGLERTELGDALVTTPAQTAYDLLMKPKQGGMPEVALAAAQDLRGQIRAADLAHVVERWGRANTPVRQMLRDLERNDVVVAERRPATGILDPTEQRVQASYANRADEYIALLGSMQSVHPSDKYLVSAWAAQNEGLVVDAGCGPGHWTGHLSAQGVRVIGIDQVPAFLEHARARHEGVSFLEGSIDELPLAAGSVAGVLAWYSLIHHDPDTIHRALDEFARVLEPGGALLIGFFVGPDVEPFDHAVVRAWRWSPDALAERLTAAGFEVIETHTRSVPQSQSRPHGAILARRISVDGQRRR